MTRRHRVAFIGVIALVGILSLSVGMTGGLLSDDFSLDGNEIEGDEESDEYSDDGVPQEQPEQVETNGTTDHGTESHESAGEVETDGGDDTEDGSEDETVESDDDEAADESE